MTFILNTNQIRGGHMPPSKYSPERIFLTLMKKSLIGGQGADAKTIFLISYNKINGPPLVYYAPGEEIYLGGAEIFARFCL